MLEAVRGRYDRFLLWHIRRSWAPLRDGLARFDYVPWEGDVVPLIGRVAEIQSKAIAHVYRSIGEHMRPVTLGGSASKSMRKDAVGAYTVLIESWIEDEMGRHIKHISDTTLADLRSVMDASANVHEFHTGISRYFAYDVQHRSYTIARTESAAASNVAADRLVEATGLSDGKTKRWTTILDGNEREGHRQADGAVVAYGDVFEIPSKYGMDLLSYPLDSSRGASAANIVNCRCFVQYVDSD